MRLRHTLGWILFAAAVGAAGYGAFTYRGAFTPNAQVPAGGAASSTETGGAIVSAAPRTLPAGGQEYRNERYRISLLHPSGLAVKTYDEGGGAATIVFQNVAASQGFQIFIVPYGEEQVTPERFRLDAPSGVMQSPLDIYIGGVPARSFYSRDALLGDTAEIWLIYRGYLYEITAPRPQAGWLSGIMATWQFTQ